MQRHPCDALSASWISYYPWYLDSLTGERKKMSRVLVEIYSASAKAIRAKGRRIKPGKREYWLLKHAEEFVRDGAKLIGLENIASDQIVA